MKFTMKHNASILPTRQQRDGLNPTSSTFGPSIHFLAIQTLMDLSPLTQGDNENNHGTWQHSDVAFASEQALRESSSV